jgi:hypothetical protein
VLRILVIMLAVVDVLLKGQSPGNIVNLRNIVAVKLERTQELVEAEARVARNMGDSNGVARRMECCGNDDSRNMIAWHHVNTVVD